MAAAIRFFEISFEEEEEEERGFGFERLRHLSIRKLNFERGGESNEDEHVGGRARAISRLLRQLLHRIEREEEEEEDDEDD
jgi:hypothetical protein